MSLVRLFFSLCLFSTSIEVLAQRKEIREVDTNDRIMKVVNLTLGRSTVISFQEKPVKIVSGNSNYFNVEFVGNDLTLQPLAAVETNLFVYTEKGTKFGFLLKVGSVALYDDILYIKWKTFNEIQMKNVPPQKILQPFKLFTNGIEIKVTNFKRLGEFRSYVLDLEVSSRNKIKTSSIDIFVSRTNQRFIGQKLVWEKDELPSETPTKARVITRIEQPQDFSLIIQTNGKETKSIITKDYL